MIADILKSTNEKTQNWFKGLATKLLIFFVFLVSQTFHAQQSKEYVRKSIENKDVAKRLVELGGEPTHISSAETKLFVENELDKLRKVINLRKIERQ